MKTKISKQQKPQPNIFGISFSRKSSSADYEFRTQKREDYINQLSGTKLGILLLSKRIQLPSKNLINNFMSEKTRINNDTEDELNQARFFAERGAEVDDVE